MTTIESPRATGLAEVTCRIDDIAQELSAEVRRHREAVEALDARGAVARAQRDLIIASGISLATIELAETLIEVRGREHASVGDGPKVIGEAIRVLARGGRTRERDLTTHYLGTKNYDRWCGQAEGGTYGSSPTHGSTIFSIGFRKPYRREPQGQGETPTPEQLDAAIAYFHALLVSILRR